MAWFLNRRDQEMQEQSCGCGCRPKPSCPPGPRALRASRTARMSRSHWPGGCDRPSGGTGRTRAPGKYGSHGTNRPDGDQRSDGSYGSHGTNRPDGDQRSDGSYGSHGANRPDGDQRSDGSYGTNRPYRSRRPCRHRSGGNGGDRRSGDGCVCDQQRNRSERGSGLCDSKRRYGRVGSAGTGPECVFHSGFAGDSRKSSGFRPECGSFRNGDFAHGGNGAVYHLAARNVQCSF